jgi:nucleotide-binding universal stress UspA family protein
MKFKEAIMKTLYRHILVPTNFDSSNQAAYQMALTTARGAQSAVTLLHVLPNESYDDYRGLDAIKLLHRSVDEKWSNWKKTVEQNTQEEIRCLERLRGELDQELINQVEVRLEVRRGELTEEIIRYVQEKGVDLIVTTGSRPGFMPQLSRRLADRLARSTPIKIVDVTPPITASM